MAFKVLFLAHAPDAEPEKHMCMVETGKYKLFVRVVKGQSEALEVCRNLVKEEGIHSKCAALTATGANGRNLQDKTLKLYNGFYHEIFNEPKREQIFKDMETWLVTHT